MIDKRKYFFTFAHHTITSIWWNQNMNRSYSNRTEWTLVSRVCCLGRGKHHNESYRKREDSRILFCLTYVPFVFRSAMLSIRVYMFVYVCLLFSISLFFAILFCIFFLFDECGSATVRTCTYMYLFVLFLFSVFVCAPVPVTEIISAHTYVYYMCTTTHFAIHSRKSA